MLLGFSPDVRWSTEAGGLKQVGNSLLPVSTTSTQALFFGGREQYEASECFLVRLRL